MQNYFCWTYLSSGSNTQNENSSLSLVNLAHLSRTPLMEQLLQQPRDPLLPPSSPPFRLQSSSSIMWIELARPLEPFLTVEDVVWSWGRPGICNVNNLEGLLGNFFVVVKNALSYPLSWGTLRRKLLRGLTLSWPTSDESRHCCAVGCCQSYRSRRWCRDWSHSWKIFDWLYTLWKRGIYIKRFWHYTRLKETEMQIDRQGCLPWAFRRPSVCSCSPVGDWWRCCCGCWGDGRGVGPGLQEELCKDWVGLHLLLLDLASHDHAVVAAVGTR